MSRYGGSGWTWDDARQAYYFHQYSKHTPDLNHTDLDVRKQMLVSSSGIVLRNINRRMEGNWLTEILIEDGKRQSPPNGSQGIQKCV